MSARKNHAPGFKAAVALAAISGEKAIAALSFEFGVHKTLIYKWMRQLRKSAPGIFSEEIKPKKPERKPQFADREKLTDHSAAAAVQNSN